MVRLTLRRSTVSALVTVLAMQVVAGAAGAAQLEDQVQTVADHAFCVVRNRDAACYNGGAQTITVGRSGEIYAVDLLLSRGSQTTGSLTIELRATSPSGTLLATSDPVPAAAIPVGEYDGEITNVAWVTFQFSAPPAVHTGDVVAIVIPSVPLDDGAWGWAKVSADVYSGGASWGGSAPGSWGEWYDGSDFAFATYLQVGPSPFTDTLVLPVPLGHRVGLHRRHHVRLHRHHVLPRAAMSPGSRWRASSPVPSSSQASAPDAFTDDEASPHEPNINLVAKAGIATGCAATKYCPAALVSREQMASFLARALKLSRHRPRRLHRRRAEHPRAQHQPRREGRGGHRLRQQQVLPHRQRHPWPDGRLPPPGLRAVGGEGEARGE